MLRSRSHIGYVLRLARVILPIAVVCAPVLSALAAPVIIEVPTNSSSMEIQEALDRLPVSGGEVHLAAGTYRIKSPLLLHRDNQALRGTGAATILQLVDGAECPVVILGAPWEKSGRVPAHVRLEGVFIDGNRAHQKFETWKAVADGAFLMNNGVIVWGVKDAVVERVTCARCRSGGLVSAHGTRDLTVDDFTSYDNQYDGLACYDTEDSHFTKLFLHDNLAAGISLDLSFKHNQVDDAKLNNNDLGIFMRDSCNNQFKALAIRHSHHHGVFMAQAGDMTSKGWKMIPGTQCTGNSFKDLTIADCGGKAVLVNDLTCTNNTVMHAQFKNNAQGDLIQAAPNLVTMLSGVP